MGRCVIAKIITIATTITIATHVPLFVLLYIGWSLESLEGWSRYLRLGVPGMFMICLEWISFEVAAIVLGTVNEIELAVHGILINYLTLIFMVSLTVCL